MRVRVVELERISGDDWRRVVAGEPRPWGGVGETLVWRDKTRSLAVYDDAGNPVALAGLVLAQLRVGGSPLEVAGIGGVIVTRAARGRGLARTLIERALEIAGELEARRAMLFCREANVGLYEKFGFRVIEEQVWVRQPDGKMLMPLRSMWKPLTSTAGWPAGEVEVLGEPF